MRVSAIVLCMVALFVLASSLPAADWTYVDSSGFTTLPSQMQDYNRIRFSSLAADDAGNVYAAISGWDASVTPAADLPGLTIFTSGGKIDVNLTAAGFPGKITKLIKAGDGKVYGLQNWQEINWNLPSVQPMRVIRVNADGSIELVWDAGAQRAVTSGWSSDYPAGCPLPQIVDLGGGNSGIQMGPSVYGEYWTSNTADTSATLAARLRFDSYTLDPVTNKLIAFQLVAKNNIAPGGPFMAFGIKNIAGVDRFCLMAAATGTVYWQSTDPADSAFHEAAIFIDATTLQVRFAWDGLEVYTGTVSTDADKSKTGTVWVEWGAGSANSDGGPNTPALSKGTSRAQITWDWLGYNAGYIAPGGTYTKLADGSFYYGPVNNTVGGLTVDGSGDLYWTAASDSPYGRVHFLWRYNVASGTVEEAPIGTKDQGWGEDHRQFDLEWCGGSNFGILGKGVLAIGGSSTASRWRLDPIGWTTDRKMVTGNDTDPGWGRAWVTALAYDKDRQAIWAGGRGTSGGAGDIIANKVLDPPSQAVPTVVDADPVGEPGNKAIRITKDLETSGYAYGGNRLGGVNWPSVTVAARMKVDAYAGVTDPTKVGPVLMFVQPAGTAAASTYGVRAELRLQAVDVGGGVIETHLWLARTYELLLPMVDLGPVPTGYHTYYLSSEAKVGTATDLKGGRVVLWMDGVRRFDNGWSVFLQNGNTYTRFGSYGVGFGAPGVGTGTNTILYDWVGIANKEVAPSDPTSSFNYYYYDGSKLPTAFAQYTNVMTQWVSPPSNGTMFDATTGAVGSMAHWHANGKNPQGQRNDVWTGGNYWVNALAVNPVDGRAWMAWGADANYKEADLGRVVTRPYRFGGADAPGSEGTPEAGAQVVGLTFSGSTVYALTFNLTSGAYSLYKAAVTDAGGAMTIGAMKGKYAGISVTTNVPKIVTYPAPVLPVNYFYIEDADRSSGIKVLTGSNTAVALQGDKVNVTGILDYVGGEAVIHATAVTPDSTGNPDLASLGVTGRAVGGGKSGIQPATTPGVGLSTVGLLVKLAGIATLVEDETNAPQWVAIDDGSGATVTYTNSTGLVTVKGIKVLYDDNPWTLTTGDKVSVTGVVSVEGGKAILRARSQDDLQPY